MLIFPSAVSALVRAVSGATLPYPALIAVLLVAGVLARQYFSNRTAPSEVPAS
jgi:hypothetical protein